MMSHLTILHTNDLHNCLSDAQSLCIRQWKASFGVDCLLLDAGDAIGAGNITYRPAGEPILTRMTQAGYDAMVVGNREFHFTQHGFASKVSKAGFPVLCANVRVQDQICKIPVTASISIVKPSGYRVGLIGLTVPMITQKMFCRHASCYVFTDPLETAALIVPELRSQCDLVICISHLGITRDRALASAISGIDVIVGGHSHTELPRGERQGDTVIVQTGSHAKHIGIVSVDIGKGVSGITAKLEPL